MGIAEDISTGLLLYLRVYLLSSVQVLISRVFLVRVLVSRGLRSDLLHVGHFIDKIIRAIIGEVRCIYP